MRKHPFYETKEWLEFERMTGKEMLKIIFKKKEE